jgi:hypothetical protein
MSKPLFDFRGDRNQFEKVMQDFISYATDLAHWSFDYFDTPENMSTLDDLKQAILAQRTPDNIIDTAKMRLPFITNTGEHRLFIRFYIADNMDDMRSIDECCSESVGYCGFVVVHNDLIHETITNYGAVGSDSFSDIYPILYDEPYHQLVRVHTDEDLRQLFVSAAYHFVDDDAIMDLKRP